MILPGPHAKDELAHPQFHQFKRYGYEIIRDEESLESLQKSHLRTFDQDEAEIFIPPIPFSRLSLSRSTKYRNEMAKVAFEELLRQQPFIENKGHKHVIFASIYSLYRRSYVKKVGIHTKLHGNFIYDALYNMTPIQSWDPHSVEKSIKKGFDFNDFFSTLKQEIPPLSKYSISFTLGDSVKTFPLKLASLDKFHTSTNLVFYQTRMRESLWNSTIYRHAPVTNIILDKFPKSCIGLGLKHANTWQKEYGRSKFCLMIRGDTPKSHSLWRSIRLGCIPVIVSDTLPHVAPIMKHILHMQDYAVFIDEKELLQDAEIVFRKLMSLTDAQIKEKIQHLAFAQQVLFPDHPDTLFSQAFVYEVLSTWESTGIEQ
ncbi:hypothetical protein CTEN210_13499 [Chaetoceros tenuissimus]|uniref:Exostosin GT47 domain-containing protein n=1 Tax=Chaetoceros tenuissimus TaxID=426638 RepID=A0AAD3D3D7_9STRA|nr:hypothetical protein CTEN210_13499 [Chaetoceros tenuissimus]